MEAFAESGFNVFGLEASEIAYKLAVRANVEKGFAINYKLGDVLKMPYSNELFEGIYCFNTLHIFMAKERKKVIDNVYCVLKKSGIAVFTVFSNQDLSFGIGNEIESNTFEGKKGRPAHYFTEKDLSEHFYKFLILENSTVKEAENHGTGPHIHILRTIAIKKA